MISVHPKLRSHDGMAQNESRRFNFGRHVSSEVFVVADQLASHAILDTGASRCIIGDKTFSRLCQVLPERLLKSIKNRPSQVKFRFGNNQTLTSMYQVLFPLKQAPNSKLLNLAVEVVPGYTPFLFSKRAFKLLGGILDTQTDSCQLSAINTQVKLALSPTGLYLLNIIDICREYNPGVSEAAFAIQSCPAGVSSEHAGESKPTTESVSQCLTQSNTRAKCVSSAPFEHPTCRKFPIRRVCQQNAQHGRVYQDHSQCTGASSHVALAAGSSPAGRIVDRDGRDSPNRDVQSSRSDDAGTADASSSVGNVGSTSEQSSCQPQDADHRSDVPTGVRSKSESKQPECQSTWEESKQSGLCSRGSTIGIGVGLRGRALHDRPFRRHHHQSSALGESDGCSDNFLNDCCSSPSRKSIDQGKNLITRDSGDSTSRPDSGCLGSTCHQLGKETQGQAILRGPEGRPGVLRVEPSSIQQSSSRSTGLCSLLPSSSEPLQFAGWSVDFHQDVMSTREQLKQSAKSFRPLHSLKKTIKSIDRIESKVEKVMTTDCIKRFGDRVNTSRGPIKMLEIYAERQSPLTAAVTASGHKAMRFTKHDGDLSTFSGRLKLWSWIEQYNPEHIWMAPECGPWGGWNRLNQHKSLEMFDQIYLKQQREMIHVKLCAEICEHQVNRGRHFHLEQPLGSSMYQLPTFQYIRQHTARAIFDMCQFGLKIPQTDQYIRKRSQVFTSSQPMFLSLNQCLCNHQHLHHRIEGSHRFPGIGVQRVSRFCASYCQGFAKRIAREICSPNHMAVSTEQLA